MVDDFISNKRSKKDFVSTSKRKGVEKLLGSAWIPHVNNISHILFFKQHLALKFAE